VSVEVVILGPEKSSLKVSVENRARVGDILRKLGLVVTEYVVLRNGVVVTEEDEVASGDKLILYPAKSGG